MITLLWYGMTTDSIRGLALIPRVILNVQLIIAELPRKVLYEETEDAGRIPNIYSKLMFRAMQY